ncbi:MAG: hypothetical protein K0Q49_1932 [Haloplasmataceae bacterium]|jgi:uncharacterized membrane protein YkvA (DUF1232 family)|nr:hypothetical protein [Haloplasmataceae bacterium]
MIIKDIENDAVSIIDDPKKTTKLLIVANRKAHSERKFLENIWHYLMLLISLITDWVKGEYRQISFKAILGFIVGLLYFVNPFDAIIDHLPGIGLIDDIALLSFIIDSFKADLTEYELWKKAINQPEVTVEI